MFNSPPPPGCQTAFVWASFAPTLKVISLPVKVWPGTWGIFSAYPPPAPTDAPAACWPSIQADNWVPAKTKDPSKVTFPANTTGRGGDWPITTAGNAIIRTAKNARASALVFVIISSSSHYRIAAGPP
jgi:hypothetical protein